MDNFNLFCRHSFFEDIIPYIDRIYRIKKNIFEFILIQRLYIATDNDWIKNTTPVKLGKGLFNMESIQLQYVRESNHKAS